MSHHPPGHQAMPHLGHHGAEPPRYPDQDEETPTKNPFSRTGLVVIGLVVVVVVVVLVLHMAKM